MQRMLRRRHPKNYHDAQAAVYTLKTRFHGYHIGEIYFCKPLFTQPIIAHEAVHAALSYMSVYGYTNMKITRASGPPTEERLATEVEKIVRGLNMIAKELNIRNNSH